MDVIQKYLFEVDYINCFKMLMFEGIFGLILSSLYSIKANPFKKKLYIFIKKKKRIFYF